MSTESTRQQGGSAGSAGSSGTGGSAGSGGSAEAKAEILARIRTALADDPQPEPVERTYRRTSDRPPAEVREILIDRLLDYKARAFVEPADRVAARIAELLGEDCRYIVPAGLDAAWLPEDTAGRQRVVEETEALLSTAELDALDAVVTSSTVSCAETGTIFLNASPDEGRRAISLVPDHHICIVPAGTIVELVPEALARVDHVRPVTMFSGPSATSDIELQRVEGVHGPRKLDVIIIED